MTKGRYGIHGGQYIPETLMNAVIELEEAYNHYKNDKEFNDALNTLLNEYAGRPSRLYYAKRMTEDLGGAKIYLKREDLNHTGAHKINNVLGQVLLAKKMGYISEKMKPVEMTSGTKSLLLNKDGTYSILFKWNENVIKNIEKEVLRQFTSWYFRNFNVLIVSDGVILKNLSEDNVFSRENIDIIRKYDIQLRCLDPQIDKIVLLHAIMQRACIYSPENILSEKYFDNNRIGRNISIPNKSKERIKFNEFGTNHMLCGKVSYNEEYKEYNYYITVPYNEYIRELMLSTEKIIKHKYGVYVSFSPFNEGISVSSHRNVKIEREFFVLDCAIKLLHVERDFNHYQLYDAIISLLEADSSGIFVKEYFETLKMLKEVLPEKWL